MKRSKLLGESSHFLNLLEIKCLVCVKIRTTNFSKAHLLYRLSYDNEALFICFIINEFLSILINLFDEILVPTPCFFRLISGPFVSSCGFQFQLKLGHMFFSSI